MWYSAVGCLTVVVVGLIVSGVTGFQDPKKLNPDLICNVGDTLYWFMPKKVREFLRFKVGDDYVSIFIHSPKKNIYSSALVSQTKEEEQVGTPRVLPNGQVNAAFHKDELDERNHNSFLTPL